MVSQEPSQGIGSLSEPEGLPDCDWIWSQAGVTDDNCRHNILSIFFSFLKVERILFCSSSCFSASSPSFLLFVTSLAAKTKGLAKSSLREGVLIWGSQFKW